MLIMRIGRFRPHDAVAGKTVLSHITSHLDPSGVGLLPGGEELPDSKPRGLNEMGWAPGAWDGVVTHHVGQSSAADVVERMFKLVARAINRKMRSSDFGKLYELARTEDVVASVDPLLTRVRASGLPATGIRQLGQRLASESRHREPVKLGIALLGLIAGDPDRDLLLTLGRHDEFTLYAAVAIANTAADETRDQTLMSLARSVDGWGRVHVVERLAGSEDPVIQSWLLREGFRNAIMPEYLAHTAATTGKLAEALGAQIVDDKLMDAAGELISALINGGPAKDIDDYEDGPVAITRFIDHVEGREKRLSQFVAIDDISEFLSREDGWDRREAYGWTPELRERLTARCAAIKAHPGWVDLANAGLMSDDSAVFFDADRTARSLGIDTFPAHWRRVRADPLHGNWFTVTHSVDATRLPEVLRFAREALPLSELGSGPSDDGTSTIEFRTHMALEFVVTELRRFPGEGWDLVATCLRSPVIRSRNMAINTLEAWPATVWPRDASAAIAEAYAAEPDEKVRQRLASLIEQHIGPQVVRKKSANEP